MTEAISHFTLKEWEVMNPESGGGLEGVSLTGGNSVKSLAQMLARQSLLEVTELRTGLRVQSFSYVGKVRLGSIEFTILPKLDHSTLLSLLRYAYGFRKLRLFTATLQQLDKAGFEDLLVSQLNAEVTELIARGLHRSYIARHEPLTSPRGRLDIQRIASGGGIISSALPCIHHPRIEDSLLNQVLLAGLRMAGRVASDIQLRRESRQLAGMFEERVSRIRVNVDVLGTVERRMNRLTTAYEPSIVIIRLLAESQGVSLDEGRSRLSLPGFLFDMNRFFQALLTRFLREHLPGYVVRDEHRLRGMMRYQPGFNPRNRRSPDPRPDFIIEQGTQRSALLDAKYRDLWEKPLPRDMLYQLAVYASSHPSKVATILYPTTAAGASEARVEIRDPVSLRQLGQVKLRPVYLPYLEELLSMRSPVVMRQRAAYAEQLAFGASARAS